MNFYAQIISKALNVDADTATAIQDFINKWFDGFHWSSATEKQIIRVAKEAQAMMSDIRYIELFDYKAGA